MQLFALRRKTLKYRKSQNYGRNNFFARLKKEILNYEEYLNETEKPTDKFFSYLVNSKCRTFHNIANSAIVFETVSKIDRQTDKKL